MRVDNLSVTFSSQVVRGISFEVAEGEAVGIVGESGSGKSATVHALMGLSRGKVSGHIDFEGEKKLGMVFQDPMSALNPTMKIGAQITEGMIYHKHASRQEAKEKAIELLRLVGIPDPEIRFYQYPHEFSGGMRQRVLIAIAISCQPRLLIADEPTTALDSKTKTQILDLIKQMQAQLKMSLLLVSHDFRVVANYCDRVLVMYAGKIVESGTVQEVLQTPKHPYTQMLLRAMPRAGQSRTEPLQVIEGSPPNLFVLPKGCAFKDRCPFAESKCQEEPTGKIACWKVL